MKETFQIPTPETLEALTGKELYDLWTSLHQLIEQKYNMEQMWNHGGKKWTYEYKYRRGGKTLCALYAKEQTIGFMVILGKEERTKFESMREMFSNAAQKIYDETTTFHDGKWLMFELYFVRYNFVQNKKVSIFMLSIHKKDAYYKIYR